LKKDTYFKFDAAYLEDEALLQKVKDAWGTREADQDLLEFWSKEWYKIGPIMKAEKKKRQNRYLTLDLQRLELETLRKQVSNSSTEDEKEKLWKLEMEIRDTERKETIIWRRRSQVRWLSLGDAPSKYFYAQLKAKHIRETIKVLENPEGELVESDQGLLSTVQDCFTNWFKWDPAIKANQVGRDAALELLSTRVSVEDNEAIVAEPEDEEIERVIRDMKKETAPGVDGITAEMLLGCWDFLGGDCCSVIHAFWKKKVL
jgi:hypothetical protein